MKKTILLVLILMTGCTVTVRSQPVLPPVPTIPVCQEDEPMLMGDGDFKNGRYEIYRCMNYSDFLENVGGEDS